ncbi:MAG TPA: hypothetical protein VK814_00540 [Acidobacteriaceae bacterium]|nr:hypothetical protein [Acidobacteriaceae bacterium]
MTMTGTMRTGWRVLAVGVVCGVMVCPAMPASKSKLPVPSTWELDLLRSDFGGGPKMQSEVFTVNDDKPAMMSLDFVMVDDAGRTVKSSWSGPQNGKMLPLTGSAGTSFGIDKEGNEHWVFADGATRVGKMSLEKDKRTVLVRVVYTGKDGKQYNQVLMYNRTDQ